MFLKLATLTQLSSALFVPDIEVQVSLATVGELVGVTGGGGGAGQVEQTGQVGGGGQVDGDDAVGGGQLGGQVGGAGQDGGGGQLQEDVTFIRPESTLNRKQDYTKYYVIWRKVFEQTSM